MGDYRSGHYAGRKVVEGLVTLLVAFGKAEAEATTMASMEIAARVVPMMIALTVALSSQPPAKKCMDL